MITPQWKLFERVVAAIHIAKSRGASVTWNEDIDGRQFDVVVRHNDGIHDYLTIVECRRLASPLQVDAVDAFVTKARSARANKAVIVSSSGFQSGCMKVAREHGITLLTLTEHYRADGIPSVGTEIVWEVFDVEVEFADGPRLKLRDENGSLQYLLQQSKVYGKSSITSLADAINKRLALDPTNQLNVSRDFEVPLFKRAVTIPQETERRRASTIRFKAQLCEARILKGPRVEPSLLENMSKSYRLYDELTSRETTIDALGLPLGFDTKLEAGLFYTSPDIGNGYYVDKVENGLADFVLLESYIDGHLFQAGFSAKTDCSKHYVEVTEREHLRRLRILLADYQRKVAGSRK